jgi:hypothetical protein
MSQPTFDLRLATLAEAYRRGELTPRALLADPPEGAGAESRVSAVYSYPDGGRAGALAGGAGYGCAGDATAVRRAVRHQR